jgi:SAM-dependent methyltransferase
MRHPGPVEHPGSLAATGERTVPGALDEAYWFARHEVAYAWIAARARSTSPRVIVDAGAGEGYGARMLREATGARVVALEYDVASCAHMHGSYADVDVVTANLCALPLRSASADLIASLQVVEHLWDLAGFLAECRRALRAAGELIATTPHRLTFSPGLGRGEKPRNPFHVEEFDADQFQDLLLTAGFDDVTVVGVHHGPRLTAWEADHGSLVEAQVEAMVAGSWEPGLRDFVAGITADDFVIGGPAATSEDLLAIARVRA